MRKLSWDKQLIWSGIGGLAWQDSRSPKSCVASNDKAPADLLKSLFDEVVQHPDSLKDFSQPVLWHLSFNASTPEEVLAKIVSLIESEQISDEMTRIQLLSGAPEDYPFGLITNKAVKGELRQRVEKLLIDHNLDPKDYEILD